MLRDFILMSILFSIMGCGSNSNKVVTSSIDTSLHKTESTLKIRDSLSEKSSNDDNIPSWCDTLIMQYIKHTHNEMIEVERADTSINIGWILDSRDSSYFNFQLGHDVTDSGGTDPRFVTDGWVSIDSLTRKIYEYDVAGDSLIPVDYNRKYDPAQFQPGDYVIKASNDHKIYFHSTPDDISVRKAFFSTPQQVYVEKILNGYGYIEFTNTNRQKSYGWIDVKDMTRLAN
jgi:hypothetical protein